jgi:hypothetical protein
MTRRVLIVVVGAALALGACSGDDDDVDVGEGTTTTIDEDAPTSAAPTSAPTSTPPETTAPCPPLENPTVGESTSGPASGAGLLTDVALTTGDCTDEVTFTFDAQANDAPGYRIAYEQSVIQDGSGETLDVDGNAFLVLRFEPGYGYDFETGTPTYTGPDSISSPGAFFVKEVAAAGDFEGVLTWAIGVDEVRPYEVIVEGTTTRTVTVLFR